MIIYELKSINLTNLGGPMGSESTTVNWTVPFETLNSAKKFAQKDYTKHRPGKKIKWSKKEKRWTSGDLLFVMYDIECKEVLK